jgi:hypothetical protein
MAAPAAQTVQFGLDVVLGAKVIQAHSSCRLILKCMDGQEMIKKIVSPFFEKNTHFRVSVPMATREVTIFINVEDEAEVLLEPFQNTTLEIKDLAANKTHLHEGTGTWGMAQRLVLQ